MEAREGPGRRRNGRPRDGGSAIVIGRTFQQILSLLKRTLGGELILYNVH
jgi:hypothetical protein